MGNYVNLKYADRTLLKDSVCFLYVPEKAFSGEIFAKLILKEKSLIFYIIPNWIVEILIVSNKFGATLANKQTKSDYENDFYKCIPLFWCATIYYHFLAALGILRDSITRFSGNHNKMGVFFDYIPIIPSTISSRELVYM